MRKPWSIHLRDNPRYNILMLSTRSMGNLFSQYRNADWHDTQPSLKVLDTVFPLGHTWSNRVERYDQGTTYGCDFARGSQDPWRTCSLLDCAWNWTGKRPLSFGEISKAIDHGRNVAVGVRSASTYPSATCWRYRSRMSTYLIVIHFALCCTIRQNERWIFQLRGFLIVFNLAFKVSSD